MMVLFTLSFVETSKSNDLLFLSSVQGIRKIVQMSIKDVNVPISCPQLPGSQDMSFRGTHKVYATIDAHCPSLQMLRCEGLYIVP